WTLVSGARFISRSVRATPPRPIGTRKPRRDLIWAIRSAPDPINRFPTNGTRGRTALSATSSSKNLPPRQLIDREGPRRSERIGTAPCSPKAEAHSPMTGRTESGSDRRGPAGEDPSEQAKGKLFLRLFLQNKRRLYAYVLTLLPNRADADDVLQEASLVLWDKFDEHNPPND